MSPVQVADLSPNGTIEWPADLPVIAAHRRREALTPVPVFSDDTWNLAALGKRSNQPDHGLTFTSVKPRHREAAKRIMWLAINQQTPADLQSAVGSNARVWLGQGTLDFLFAAVRNFLNWLDDDIEDLSMVTADVLNQYLADVLSRRHSEGPRAGEDVRGRTKESWLRSVVRIHLYADQLPEEDRLIRPPWLDERLTLRRNGDGSNQTEELLPEVYGPLLVWATLFVEEFAPDILAARQLANQQAVVDDTVPPRERVRAVLDASVRAKGTLPAYRVTAKGGGGTDLMVAATYVAFIAGVSRTYVGTIVDEEYAHVPLGESSPLDVPITGRVDGRPWTPFIDYYEVDYWVSRLREACMVLIALGTGLRPEEYLSLTAEASKDDGTSRAIVERIESENGQVRWLVHGRLFKGMTAITGEQRLDGIPVTWETVEIGAKAASIAVTLAGDSPYLFTSENRGRGSSDEPMQTRRANSRLALFTTATDRLVDSLNLPNAYRVPVDVFGAISSRQFRRTTLAMIEDQHEGLLAGAYQAKHLVGNVYDTRTTEGYGDTRNRGQLVHERRSALSMAALMQLSTELLVNGEGISGPALGRALAVVESAGGDLMRLTDERAFKRLASKTTQKVYRVEKHGAGWFCIHDRTLAACSNGQDPELGECKIACANKVYTDSDRESVQRRIEALEAEAELLPKPAADRKRLLADEWREELTRSGSNVTHLGMPTMREKEVN